MRQRTFSSIFNSMRVGIRLISPINDPSLYILSKRRHNIRIMNIQTNRQTKWKILMSAFNVHET